MGKLPTLLKLQPFRIFGYIFWCCTPEECLAGWLRHEWGGVKCMCFPPLHCEVNILMEQCVCIRLCWKLGNIATETYNMLHQLFGVTAFSLFKTSEWNLCFNCSWRPLKNIHMLTNEQQCKATRMLTTSVHHSMRTDITGQQERLLVNSAFCLGCVMGNWHVINLILYWPCIMIKYIIEPMRCTFRFYFW